MNPIVRCPHDRGICGCISDPCRQPIDRPSIFVVQSYLYPTTMRYRWNSRRIVWQVDFENTKLVPFHPSARPPIEIPDQLGTHSSWSPFSVRRNSVLLANKPIFVMTQSESFKTPFMTSNALQRLRKLVPPVSQMAFVRRELRVQRDERSYSIAGSQLD